MQSVYEEIAIAQECFLENLKTELNLIKINSPLFVEDSTGLNDELNYVETPVSFKTSNGKVCSVVHSLSKWKRYTLSKIIQQGSSVTGIVTDMNGIRKDEEKKDIETTKVHSYYVDQWDWEMIIQEHERTIDVLKSVVRKIYKQLLKAKKSVCEKVDTVSGKNTLPEEITFITSQELEDMYPDISPEEREQKYTVEKKAVFIIGIGAALASGVKHGTRAPDYDDWSLNGDLLVFNSVIGSAVELSSMGIRVNKESLKSQLKIMEKEDKLKLEFHSSLMAGEFPFTIGGGIGKSRTIMFLLEKNHIAEVQCAVWPDSVVEAFKVLR